MAAVGHYPEMLEALKARLADYRHQIAPTGYQVPYAEVRQRVVDSVPAGGTWVQENATTWWVYFPTTQNPTRQTKFKLYW